MPPHSPPAPRAVLARRRPPGPSAPPERPRPSSFPALIAFFAAHAVLGLAMKQVPALGTIHGWVSFLVALRWAATGKSPGKVVAAVCYLAGSDLLWRMTGAGVFWEFGKYSAAVVLLVSLARHRPSRFNGWALLYFALLLPSLVLTLQAASGLDAVRNIISFNLSGPFLLAVSTYCLFGLPLRAAEAERSLLAVLGPITGAAAICLSGTASLGANYEFGNESNFDNSGGFGPNQVSSMLGFGMLAVFLWMQSQPRWSARWSLGVLLIVGFAAQSMLTFSRSGLWIGLITIGLASLFLLRTPSRMLPGLVGALLILGLGYFLVFPLLDQFTGGKLSARFTEKGFSRREDIAGGDLVLALRNPLLGVGVGRAGTERQAQLDIHGIAHTEFTRMLAEHGLTGLLALGALLAMAVLAVTRGSDAFSKAWTVSLLAFTMLFMMGTGMRLAIPSIAMGLAMMRIVSPGEADRRRKLVPTNNRLRPLEPPRSGQPAFKELLPRGPWAGPAGESAAG